MKTIKLSIWVLVLMLLYTKNLYSMPAFPKRIAVERIGGNFIKLRLCGDENNKFAIEENTGLTVVLDSLNCWRYLVVGDSGLPEVSDFLVSKITQEQQARLIENTPKGLIPNSKPVNGAFFDKRNARKAHSKKNRVVGERKALIILMQFPDRQFYCKPQDFELLFNKPDYSLNNATGSVADYFIEVSEGQLNMVSTIIGPFMAQNKMSFYGKNTNAGGGDANPFILFQEALNHAQSMVNLKDYDCDNDGYIDNIHIIYAGYGEEAGASSNAIWAHECTFPPIEIDKNLRIDRYSCSPELRDNKNNIITTIGPPCHEICHSLGAMDFYDTNYSDQGEYQGTSTWDIMAAGSWNNSGATPAWPNPYVRAYNFGWSDPEVLDENGMYDFQNGSKKKIYRVDTEEENDYFLLEYRDKEYFSSGEPGSGLMIFHIGPNIEKFSETNSINATFPQQCYPICASSKYIRPTSNPSSYGNIDSPSCAFSDLNGKSVFNKSSIPGALSFSGQELDFSIENIHEDDDNLEFTISWGTEKMESTELWSESFIKSTVLDNWEQKNLKGYANWERYNILGDYLIKNYLSLEVLDGYINPDKIITQLQSPLVVLSESFMDNKYNLDMEGGRVLFYVYISNPSSSTATWRFMFVNGDNIFYDFEVEQSPGTDWTRIEKEIPIDSLREVKSFNIVIETQMESSPRNNLQLAEMRLCHNASASLQKNFVSHTSKADTNILYDIYGRSICVNMSTLPRGLYFQKSPYGTKKVFKF